MNIFDAYLWRLLLVTMKLRFASHICHGCRSFIIPDVHPSSSHHARSSTTTMEDSQLPDSQFQQMSSPSHDHFFETQPNDFNPRFAERSNPTPLHPLPP